MKQLILRLIKIISNLWKYKRRINIRTNDSDNTDLQCRIETNSVVNLAFALRYLNMFTKASSIGQQVSLFLSKEFPLIVQYKLAELGVLKFYLAPRISDNDENK